MMTLAPIYRRTILLATVTALAVLGGMVAAPAAAQSDRSSELQQLVADLDYQLKLVAQFDRHASDKRRAQLAAAIERWNDSPRGEADFQVMQQWLRRAIRASMPGLPKNTPALPRFPEPVVEASVPPTSNPSASSPAKSPAPKPSLAAKPAAPKVPESESIATPPSTPKRVASPRKAAPPVAALPAPTRAVTKFKNTPRTPKPEALAAPAPAQVAAPPADRTPWPSTEWGNPFVDDPISPAGEAVANRPPAAGTPASPEPRVVMRPAGLSTATSKANQVRVNVAELGARVRGYVQALRRVEAQLVATPDMNLQTLLEVAEELQQLADQRGFVTLYLEGLTGDNRILPAELPTLEAAKAMVESRLAGIEQPTDEPAISEQLFDEVFASPEQAFHAEAIDKIQQLLSEL